MSDLGIEIQGFEELQRKIMLLSNDRDKKREVLAILREVSKPTLKAAKALVSISKKPHKLRGEIIQPKNLQKSLGNITGKSTNPTILVGARVKGGNKGWYAAFVHDGVNLYNKGYKRKRKKGANNHMARGRTVGNPFLDKAYEQTRSGATSDVRNRMTAFVQRRIDRLS